MATAYIASTTNAHAARRSALLKRLSLHMLISSYLATGETPSVLAPDKPPLPGIRLHYGYYRQNEAKDQWTNWSGGLKEGKDWLRPPANVQRARPGCDRLLHEG
jgi:hypothetical protein